MRRRLSLGPIPRLLCGNIDSITRGTGTLVKLVVFEPFVNGKDMPNNLIMLSGTMMYVDLFSRTPLDT